MLKGILIEGNENEVLANRMGPEALAALVREAKDEREDSLFNRLTAKRAKQCDIEEFFSERNRCIAFQTLIPRLLNNKNQKKNLEQYRETLNQLLRDSEEYNLAFFGEALEEFR